MSARHIDYPLNTEGQPGIIRYGIRRRHRAEVDGSFTMLDGFEGFVESPLVFKNGKPDWYHTAAFLAERCIIQHNVADNLSGAVGRLRTDLVNAQARANGADLMLGHYRMAWQKLRPWWLYWLLPKAIRHDLEGIMQ